MAKPNPLVLKIVFIGVPLLLAVALLPTNPPKPERSPVNGRNNPVKKADPYSQDRDVKKFPSLDTPATNSFRPGVIPSRLTNDNEPWIYTGNIEIDGHKKALLENRNTGEAVYLSAGESWRGLMLLSINGDSIVVSGTGDHPKTSGSTTVKLLSFGSDQPKPDGISGVVGYSQE